MRRGSPTADCFMESSQSCASLAPQKLWMRSRPPCLHWRPDPGADGRGARVPSQLRAYARPDGPDYGQLGVAFTPLKRVRGMTKNGRICLPQMCGLATNAW